MVEQSFAASGLDHVALVVADMSRSLAWYREVLGMKRRFEDVWDGGGDPVVLCNGDACVALFEPAEDDAAGRDGVNRHFAIRLDRANFAACRAALAARGIDAELWDHTICHSLYVRDPDRYFRTSRWVLRSRPRFVPTPHALGSL